MEQEDRDQTGAAPSGTRSQHVVYTLPHDWGTIPQFMAPALERLDRAAAETQLLVVTPDAETALAVARAALGEQPVVLPVTNPARAERLLRARALPGVAGSAEALAALVRSAALKLHAVRTLVLAWPDDARDSAREALEAVLAEVPKDASRVLVATEATPDVEALVERYLRRARRVTPAAAAAEPAVALHYVAVAPAARPAALRRLLDELDPPSAVVVALDDASAAEARRTLRALGYPSGEPAPATAADAGEPTGDAGTTDDGGAAADAAPAPATAFGPDVPVTRGDVPAGTDLVVLYDVPADRAVLDRVTNGRPRRVVALAQPRQLQALARLAGAAPRPLALDDHARRARARDEAVRAELRAALAGGGAAREVLALEPLLDEHDGVEIAAAALRLLERERAAARAAGTAGPAADAGAPARGGAESSGMARLFLTVGARDGVRPGDLVGAIAGEAGIPSDRIGKIDVRDTHSLVEVAAADAARVVERVNGITIRGRRVVARPEREGGSRGDRPERGDRPVRRSPGERGAGERRPGGDRGDRPPRGDRPERGARPVRGPRPEPGGRGGPRSFDAGRGGTPGGPRGFGEPDDRAVSERAEQRGEWAERAERLRRARRGGDADEAAERPGEGPADAGEPREAPRRRDEEA